jgi:hypothetical protein
MVIGSRGESLIGINIKAKCPREDKNARFIKSRNLTPKKGPDAAVSTRNQQPRATMRLGA